MRMPGLRKASSRRRFAQDLVLEFARGLEDLRVGLEGDLGAGLLRVADDRHLLGRFALRETHLVDLAVAPDLGLEPFRDRVDALRADAVQAAGILMLLRFLQY